MPQSLSKSFGQVPYSENLQETLKRVEAKARYSPDAIATLEHLLLSLLEDPDTFDVMRRCNVGLVQLDDISFYCGGGRNDPSTPPAAEIKFSEDLHRVLSKAATAAEQANREQIDGAIVLAALVGDARCPAAEMLRKCGLTFDAVINCLENKSDIQREQSETSVEPDPFASLRDEPESSDLSSILSPLPPEMLLEDSEPESKPIDWDEVLSDIDFKEQDRKRSRPKGIGGGSRERIGASEVGAASENRMRSRPMGVGAGSRRRIGASEVGAASERSPYLEQGFGGALRPSLREMAYKKRLQESRDQESLEESDIEAGKLVENIPRSMRIAIPVMVEARIAQQDSEDFYMDLAGDGEVQKHQVYVSSAMTVQLRAPTGGFTIESISPDTQWIENNLGLIDGGNFGAWRWTVTPRERGMRKLQLVVSARTTDRKGMVAESPMPDQIIEVDVSINYRELFKRAAGWIVAAIGGGALAKYGEGVVSWF